MPTVKVTIRTVDGDCPAYVISPSGDGPWSAVIFYGNAGGIQPAMLDMAEKLAGAGYLVLLHDLYYRFGSYGPLVPSDVFKGDVRAILGPLMATTGTDKAAKIPISSWITSTPVTTSPVTRSAQWVFAWVVE
jgi:carboxymethylenebutenolidase